MAIPAKARGRVKCSGSGLCSSRARVHRQPSRRPPARVLLPAQPPPARCPGRGPRHAWARCPPWFTVHHSFSPGVLAFRCSNPLRHAHAAAFSSPLVLVTQRQLVQCMQEPHCRSQAGPAPCPHSLVAVSTHRGGSGRNQLSAPVLC